MRLALWGYHCAACLISRRSQNVASLPAGEFEALFLSIAVQLTRQFRHPKSSLELLRSPPCFSNRLLNLSRGACFAAVGLLSKPKKATGQPKDICYRWQLDINSSESSLETESVGLTELGSEGPFRSQRSAKTVDVDRVIAKGSQQQIPP